MTCSLFAITSDRIIREGIETQNSFENDSFNKLANDSVTVITVTVISALTVGLYCSEHRIDQKLYSIVTSRMNRL